MLVVGILNFAILLVCRICGLCRCLKFNPISFFLLLLITIVVVVVSVMASGEVAETGQQQQQLDIFS